MTVPSSYSPALLTADGEIVDFDFDFKVFDDTDIVVALVDPDTLEATSQEITTEYTVTLSTTTTGGTVTFVTAPDDGVLVSIRRSIPLTQETDIPSVGLFRETQIENALDKAMLVVQQLDEAVDRALLQTPYTAALSLVFPAPVANKVIGWNAAGTGLENQDGPASAILAAAASASAAATSASDAATSVTAASAQVALAEGQVTLAEAQVALAASEADAASSSADAASAILASLDLPEIGASDALKLLQINAAHTAYELVAGNTAYQPVVLDEDGYIPALDGRNLLNIPAMPSVFDKFGGDGSDGAETVSAATNFSAIDSAVAGKAQFTDLTINASQTLTIDTGVAVIGVSGTLTILGTISADGRGESGGAPTAGGVRPDGVVSSSLLDMAACLSGAGGGGGGGNASAGGAGGGAGNTAGAGGSSVPGVGGNATANNATRASQIKALGFPSAPLLYKGAGGGGAGGELKSGGNGGGVIYIECDELVYSGVLTADGENGDAGQENNGGGGGGGGGVIIVRAKTLTTNTGTTTVTGGSGGADGGTESAAGGDGADGYSLIVEVG